MKRFMLIASFLIVTCLTCGTAWADCRGCCSGHGGTACVDGVTKCKDGSQMSDKCQEKCGTGTASKPSSTSTPASVPAITQPTSSPTSTKSKPGAIAGTSREYIQDLLLSVINVSMQTVALVEGLPGISQKA